RASHAAGINKKSDSFQIRHSGEQQFDVFFGDLRSDMSDAGYHAAGPRKARREAGRHRRASGGLNDRSVRQAFRCGSRRRQSHRHYDGGLFCLQLFCQRWEPIVASVCQTCVQHKLRAFLPSEHFQSLRERRAANWRLVARRSTVEPANENLLLRLRARVERHKRRSGEQQKYVAPRRHSITRSALISSDCGIVSPNAFAALRLMNSSILLGCSIGRSAGFAPLNILSTYVAARRRLSIESLP